MDAKEFGHLLRTIDASSHVKLTLTQITAIADDVEFANEIVQYVCDSVVDGRTLRPPERIVHLVTDCEYRLLRGGITDFLLQAHEPASAIDALVTIGMSDTARVLHRGLELLGAVPAGAAAAAGTMGKRTDLVGNERLDDLTRQLADASKIGQTLRVWIARHRSAFAVD